MTSVTAPARPELSHRTGLVFVFMAGVLWSTVGLGIRLIEDANVWQILLYRSVALSAFRPLRSEEVTGAPVQRCAGPGRGSARISLGAIFPRSRKLRAETRPRPQRPSRFFWNLLRAGRYGQ